MVESLVALIILIIVLGIVVFVRSISFRWTAGRITLKPGAKLVCEDPCIF